jgi:hypothetical protein
VCVEGIPTFSSSKCEILVVTTSSG